MNPGSPALRFTQAPAARLHMASILTIAMLFLVILLLIWFVKTDIYASAAARVQPVGRSKIVQPLATGRVQRILVANGDVVRKGKVLIELDSTDTQADRTSLSAQFAALNDQIERRRAAIEAARLQYKSTSNPATADVTAAVGSQEGAVLAADLNNLRAQLAALDARIVENGVEIEATRATLDAQDRIVATLKSRVDIGQVLRQKQLESEVTLLALRQEYETQAAVAASQRGAVRRLGAANLTLEKEKQGLVAKFVMENTQALASTSEQRHAVQQSLIKAAAGVQRTELRAPVDGTVQELAVTTVGQVVTVGQQLMTLVPSESALEVEAWVPNKDIGFVAVGQRAVIKIDAFPYIRHGTLSGSVVGVSRDAIGASTSRLTTTTAPTNQLADAGSGFQTLFYAVTIRLDASGMVVNGREILLIPGMTATADIKTDEQRLIQWFVSPLLKVLTEAAHER